MEILFLKRCKIKKKKLFDDVEAEKHFILKKTNSLFLGMNKSE